MGVRVVILSGGSSNDTGFGFNVSGRFWKMLHGVDFHRLKIGMLIHSANSQVYLEPGPANDAGWSA